MEEKVLIPVALEAEPGRESAERFERLKRDHGALTALLAPVPSAKILAAIRGIIALHNRLEEDPGGLYEVSGRRSEESRGCDVADALESAPQIPLRTCDDRPAVLAACRRALTRAGHDPDEWFASRE